MFESLNYSFRNPKKHNLSNLPHQTVEELQKNHGVLRGPPLVCYWLTSFEINKHKIFDTNNA